MTARMGLVLGVPLFQIEDDSASALPTVLTYPAATTPGAHIKQEHHPTTNLTCHFGTLVTTAGTTIQLSVSATLTCSSVYIILGVNPGLSNLCAIQTLSPSLSSCTILILFRCWYVCAPPGYEGYCQR